MFSARRRNKLDLGGEIHGEMIEKFTDALVRRLLREWPRGRRAGVVKYFQGSEIKDQERISPQGLLVNKKSFQRFSEIIHS